MELFKLLGTIAIENSDANSAIDDTTGKVGKGSSKMVDAFKKVGAAVATYLTVDAIKKFGAACISSASDVEEMENKFNVVFGSVQENGEWVYSELTNQVNDWATSYAKAIGRNSNTIKTYLADNQNMFVGMGATREAAASLSENLVSMALDLASFNNLNETDTVNAMSKAIMGESESAKQLGTVLNDNTRALAMEKLGYTGKFDALDEVAKMEVNYQAIVMQSTDAIGDCERSLDSYKGQQIQLASTTDNLKEKIGSYLLPVMTSLTSKANEVATFFLENLDPAFETIKSVAGDVSEFWGEVLQPAFEDVGVALVGLWNAFNPVITSLTDLLPASESNTSAMDLFREACWTLESILETLAVGINNVSQFISENKTLVEAIIIVVGSFAAAYGIVTTATTLYTAATTVAAATTTAFGAVMAFITSPIGIVVAAIGALIAIGVALYKNWDSVTAKAKELWTGIKTTFNNIKTTISNVMTSAGNVVKSAIDKIKGLFKFDWSLPKLKMPHVSINGSFSLAPPSVPTFGIDWYAKAMNAPMIMEKPTAFGINANGQLKVGGEKGSEVVSGTDTLMDMISTAVATNNTEMIEKIQKLIDLLTSFFPQVLANMGYSIVLDDGTLVGRLAPGMDAELGKIASRNERL